MSFFGYHGVHPEERMLGQRFVVDLQVYLDLRAPGRSDALQDTISYSDLHRIAKAVVEGEPHNLLESVAEAIAQQVLDSFSAEAEDSNWRVLIGDGTMDWLDGAFVIEDLGSHALKGKYEEIRIFRVLGPSDATRVGGMQENDHDNAFDDARTGSRAGGGASRGRRGRTG